MPIPHVAEAKLLEYTLMKRTPEDLEVCLFLNDHTPTKNDTNYSYKEIAAITGYKRFNLTADRWSIKSSDDMTIAEYPPIVWTFSGPIGRVYGYYIVTTSGTLMFSQRFSNGPYDVQNQGDVINVTPRILLK